MPGDWVELPSEELGDEVAGGEAAGLSSGLGVREGEGEGEGIGDPSVFPDSSEGLISGVGIGSVVCVASGRRGVVASDD